MAPMATVTKAQSSGDDDDNDDVEMDYVGRDEDGLTLQKIFGPGLTHR